MIKREQNRKTERELLTAWELSRALKFTCSTVRSMARKGEIPSIRVKGQYRFDLDAVINSLKGGRG